MLIFIDSREKPKAIQKILLEFERQNVKYVTNKMYIGDYGNPAKPLIYVERKKSLDELAGNACKGYDRFKRELMRLDDVGGKMYIVVEQDKIDDKLITSLEDIILWKPRYGEILGDRIYRILCAWKNKHNIEYVFCNRRNTGKIIIRLLGGDDEQAE